MVKNKKKRQNKKTVWALTLVIIAFLAAGYWWYASQNQPKDLGDAPSIGQQTKGEKDEDKPPHQNSDPKQEGETNPKVLLEPSGNYVSSHEAETNSLIASSCTTTSGASCVVVFTRNGVTKTLPEQTTDSEGATFWEWTPKQIGLTPGEWVIEARASLGNETRSSRDAAGLVIK